MTKVFMFSGSSYLRYDRGDDSVDAGYPLPTAGNWPGLAEAGFDIGIDAAVNWGNGKVYFFKGGNYLRYDIAADGVDDGYPLPIAENWDGFAAAGFETGIDAAVNWGNGKVYFFKGSNYLRYDISRDSVDSGFPLPISNGWPGFAAAGFAAGVEAALDWGDGKVHFFRGPDYLRYDKAADQVDPGYPLSIAANWPGIANAGFGGGVRAVLDLFTPGELWVPGATVIRAPVNGPAYLDMPWRGVLHTTEGSNAEGAISSFRVTNFWSHFVVDPKKLQVFQHIPLNIGARSLSDHGVSANAARAIQIEIVGLAAASPGLAPEQLAFLSALVHQIDALVPIPRSSDRDFLNAAGVTSTPGNRMTAAEWKLFSGWCGHQHVPGESHTDPGALDVATILAL